MMHADDFAYDLPEELIAAHPAQRREGSRLLIVPPGAAEPPRHRHFADIAEFLRPGDLLVMNTTRVIPARLYARRPSGGQVELLLLEAQPPADGRPTWSALARPARKVRPGDELQLPGDVTARVLAERDAGERVLAFDIAPARFHEWLEAAGRMPLPPYILRRREQESPGADFTDEDRDRYQTVYARQPGSVAAPTAGLHFTRELLDAQRARGVETAELVLHVGAGTFRTMDPGSDIAAHAMHEEAYEIPAATAAAIARAHDEGRRVVAVGTTTTRALEAAAIAPGRVAPGPARTALMIAPGHSFRIVGGLITNFHLPRSTLLLLVAAMIGRRRLLSLYAEAIAHRYRFYSYGDAMALPVMPSPSLRED